MKKRDIKKLANHIWELEQECQKGNNISNNLTKMQEIADNLSIADFINLTLYLEENKHPK